ncbi:MAG: TIGR02449 family protein [Candidatus Neomarinimicrobiota bacterium]
MTDSILDNFETQIEALIERYKRLIEENARLREKQANLFAQNNTTDEKHSLVIGGIKKMVERLKMVERENGSK